LHIFTSTSSQSETTLRVEMEREHLTTCNVTVAACAIYSY
jgi:hypothetical protein